ncbi:MAG: CopG family transcriptional regulator [Candidatus Promineifilaceae bacterium]
MAETEKITINMSVVDLGQIDLLVEEGFYSNRTDFIRAAIRHQLLRHDAELKQSIVRKTMAVGVVNYSRKDLEKAQARGEQLSARVIGMLVIDDDVSPELAAATINTIKVSGVFQASKAIKEAIADRIQ